MVSLFALLETNRLKFPSKLVAVLDNTRLSLLISITVAPIIGSLSIAETTVPRMSVFSCANTVAVARRSTTMRL